MNDAASDSRTMIYKRTSTGDDIPVGYLEADGVIHRSRWEDGQPVGSVKAENRIFRNTAHGERELGRFTPEGNVHSHGLFEGGTVGWVDLDGVVVQAGLILGEEEVGCCSGPQPIAAGAALLLLFLPDDAEANHTEAQRRQ